MVKFVKLPRFLESVNKEHAVTIQTIVKSYSTLEYKQTDYESSFLSYSLQQFEETIMLFEGRQGLQISVKVELPTHISAIYHVARFEESDVKRSIAALKDMDMPLYSS